MRLSPAQRVVLLHCVQTGAWLPDDPVDFQVCVADALVRRGLLTRYEDCYEPTEAGKAYWRQKVEAS